MWITFLFLHLSYATDPYLRTFYTRAFKQDAIWNQYSQVLARENLQHLLHQNYSSIVERYAPEELNPGCFCFPSFTSHTIGFDTFSHQECDLNKALVDHFLHNKKNDALQVVRNELWSTGTYVSIAASLLGTAGIILPPSLSGVGTFVIANQMATSVSTAIRHQLELNSSQGDVLLPYELQYAVSKRFIHPALWETIESQMTLARANQDGRQQYLKFFSIVLNLPRSNKSFPDPRANFTTLMTTVDTYFNDYEDSDTIKLELKTSFWEHLTSTRRNLSLIGPSGIGKSHAVKKIAEALQIPTISLNLGLLQDASDLFGSAEQPGMLLEALSHAQFRNSIILLENAGEALQNPSLASALKILTESETLALPYLQSTSIPLRDYLFVSISNSTPPTSTEPITDITHFPRFSRTFIRHAAKELAQKILEKHIYIKNIEEIDAAEKILLDHIILESDTMYDLKKHLPLWCMHINEEKMKRDRTYMEYEQYLRYF